MPCNTKAPTIRWFYLTIGILSMLFAGILYSWSILKAPLADAFGWNASQLTMNFTLTMCFFCLGGVGGGLLARRLGTRLTIALGGAGVHRLCTDRPAGRQQPAHALPQLRRHHRHRHRLCL